MSTYIGLKIVDATPMSRREWERKRGIPGSNGEEDAPGYEVTYPLEPGEKTPYVGWCPAHVFEKYNRPVDGMTFPMALEAMYHRAVVRRKDEKTIYRIRGTDGFSNGYIECADILIPEAPAHSAFFNSADLLANDWEIVEDVEALRRSFPAEEDAAEG